MLTLTSPVRPYERAATNTIFALLQILSNFNKELSRSCSSENKVLVTLFEIATQHRYVLPRNRLKEIQQNTRKLY
jgi:hypothetical protein